MEEFIQRLDAVRGEIQRDNFCKPVELVVELRDIVVGQVENIDVVMFLAKSELVQFCETTAGGTVKAISCSVANATDGAHICKGRCNQH